MIGVASLLLSSHACSLFDDVDGCHLVSTSLMRGAAATIEDDNAAADVDDDGVRLMASWILLTRIIIEEAINMMSLGAAMLQYNIDSRQRVKDQLDDAVL